MSNSVALVSAMYGIFRQVERPTYDDDARAQLETAGAGDDVGREALAGLLTGGDPWSVA